MFFKRKNISTELQEKLAAAERLEAQEVKPSVDEGENRDLLRHEKKQQESEAKDRAVDEAKKQLSQELETKHYYHQKLLETLDLGLLSSLEKGRARKDLHDAIVQLMADDQAHALSAEGRKG